MMSDVEPELPDGSLEEPEFMEEAKISGKVLLPKVVRQEFRFAMSHWIADPHPAKYQYAIPFINVCLTYPHLRELLKAELTRWGFSYDELVIQGTGEIAHVVSDELANRYLYNTMQYSRLDGLTLQTNDEKEKIERIERGIKKGCIGLPAINEKVLYMMMILLKETDLANVSIPAESIFGQIDKKKKFSYDPRRQNDGGLPNL